MNKPKTFAVKGTELLLRAFYEELLKIGYEEGKYNFSNIDNPIDVRINVNDIDSVGEYKKLLVNDILKSIKDVTFQLPEQFNEALTFAEEQLNHPYWKMQELEEGAHYLVRWGNDNEIDTVVYKSGHFFPTGSKLRFKYTAFSKIQKIEIPKDF